MEAVAEMVHADPLLVQLEALGVKTVQAVSILVGSH